MKDKCDTHCFMANFHCGRHDKIYNEDNPCPGCENEKKGIFVSSAEANAKELEALGIQAQATPVGEEVEVPEVTSAPTSTSTLTVEGVLSTFEAMLRKTLGK